MKQSSGAAAVVAEEDDFSYLAIVKRVAREDGVQAFFTRGLFTRVTANTLQSIVFTVVWRALLDN